MLGSARTAGASPPHMEGLCRRLAPREGGLCAHTHTAASVPGISPPSDGFPPTSTIPLLYPQAPEVRASPAPHASLLRLHHAVTSSLPAAAFLSLPARELQARRGTCCKECPCAPSPSRASPAASAIAARGRGAEGGAPGCQPWGRRGSLEYKPKQERERSAPPLLSYPPLGKRKGEASRSTVASCFNQSTSRRKLFAGLNRQQPGSCGRP